MYVDTNMKGFSVKGKRGFQPKHEGTPKGTSIHFRVTDFEKALLDSIMRGDQWRDFIILLSMSYLGLNETPEDRRNYDFARRAENLFGVNIQGLLESAKEERSDQET